MDTLEVVDFRFEIWKVCMNLETSAENLPIPSTDNGIGTLLFSLVVQDAIQPPQNWS